MKIKIGNLIDAIPALRKLNSLDLPLRTSYKVFKLVEAVNAELAFFTEKRETIQKKADNRDAELHELVNQEEEIDSEKVEIILTDDIRLSAADIGALMPFIDFKEDKSHE